MRTSPPSALKARKAIKSARPSRPWSTFVFGCRADISASLTIASVSSHMRAARISNSLTVWDSRFDTRSRSSRRVLSAYGTPSPLCSVVLPRLPVTTPMASRRSNNAPSWARRHLPSSPRTMDSTELPGQNPVPTAIRKGRPGGRCANSH